VVEVIVIVDEPQAGGGGGGLSPVIFYHDLLPAEITAKKITLPSLPNAVGVIVDVIGGGPQKVGADFAVTGRDISWAGKNLDGVLKAGNTFRILYFL